MSDIQAVINLIEKSRSNIDHRDGQRQINEAVAMLKDIDDNYSHLHSEKAIEKMDGAYSWRPIETAPETGEFYFACNINTGQVCVENRPKEYYPGYWTKNGKRWYGMKNSFNATHWHPCPALPDQNDE